MFQPVPQTVHKIVLATVAKSFQKFIWFISPNIRLHC